MSLFAYLWCAPQADERRIEEVHGRLIGAADAPDAGGRDEGGGHGGGSGGGNGADQGGNGLQRGDERGSAVGGVDRSPAAAAAASKNSTQ